MTNLNFKSALIALFVSMLGTSTCLAASACDNKNNTNEISECYDKDSTDIETKINEAIEKTKKKYPDFQFQTLLSSQSFWKDSNLAKCKAIFAGDALSNQQTISKCINEEWHKRLKVIKLDVKKVKSHKKTSFDFNDNQVMQLDLQINDLTKKFIGDVATLGLSSQIQQEKQQDYQLAIDKWKRFASNYCKFHGSDVSCLLPLLKAKIESIKKDNELLVAK